MKVCERASCASRRNRPARKTKRATPNCGAALFRQDRAVRLLGFRLRLELLDLLALILKFLLLRLHLLLSLCVGVLLIQHRVADYVAGATAQNTTDQGARERMTYGRPDQRAAACTHRSAAESALFTSRKRVP